VSGTFSRFVLIPVEESDEIMSEKVPETCSELMPLLVQEPIGCGDREVGDRLAWKPEVPFIAGS
jgi:hypothetical protein